jgi:hypothetical protein
MSLERVRNYARSLGLTRRQIPRRITDLGYRLNPKTYRKGTPQWLCVTEIKYGGLRTNVPRHKVSPLDPRSREEIETGGMIGGDRMSAGQDGFGHGYAESYAEFLKPYLDRKHLTVVEAGILDGIGLAIWSTLFPDADIIGLDIDLSHFEANRDNLIRLGAFRHKAPEVFEFDQFVDNKDYLGKILDGRKIDIMIDDGYHEYETNLKTLRSAEPYLAERFVYFIEDNDQVFEPLQREFPLHRFISRGELTICRP